MTATLTTKAIPANIARKLSDIRAEASASIASIDEKIRAKTAELDQVVKSVNLSDAASLIAADIRHSIERHRQTLLRRAAAAVSLTSHVPIKTLNSINAAGQATAVISAPRPLGILEFDTDPLSVVAALWNPAHFEAFAREAALEAGAKDGGPSVAELRVTAQRLGNELEALHIERAEAKEALASLIDVTLSPLVETAFLASNPQATNTASS